MSTVFTTETHPLDRGLLGANVGVLLLALAGVVFAKTFGDFAGAAQGAIAVAVVAWMFATPLLAAFGGLRARREGRRRELIVHSALGGLWVSGMTVAMVARTLAG